MRERRSPFVWLLLSAAIAGAGSTLTALSATEPLPITRLAQLSFQVSDLQTTRQYYGDVMGFEEAFQVKDSQGQPRSVFFKVNGDQFLEFSAGAKEGEFQLSRVSFLVPDIQRAHQMLKERNEIGRAHV